VEEVSYCTLALLLSVFAENEPDSEERNSKLTSAMNYSSEGLKRAIENKNPHGIARNYYVMGMILTNILTYAEQLEKENFYIKAKNCLYESLKLSFSLNDDNLSKKCYQVLGKLSMSFSNMFNDQDKILIMEEALGYWDKALEMALKLNDFVSLPHYSFAAGKCWFEYAKLENDPRIQSNYCSNALQKLDETINYGRRLGNTDIMLKASECMLEVMAFENKVLLKTKTQIRTFKIE
jgi:tetratricopeptide (TPR) repeat protein